MKPHPILYPLSLVYGFIVWLRNLFFDVGILQIVDVGVPVISIGNITAGGSGKTPMVIAIGRYFLEKGKRVAVISRGYKRTIKGTVVVSNGNKVLANALNGGDETVLIAQRLPNAIVIADEQRVRGAKKAVEEFGAELIILDDGFQHRYLKRTCDIVLMESSRSPFETMLLPGGYRREPLHSLRRANAVIVTKTQTESEAKEIFDNTVLSGVNNKFTSSFQSVGIRNIFGTVRQSVEMVKKHTIVAVSGIANPASFKREIESIGGKVNDAVFFNDHHVYTEADIRRIIESFRKHESDYILTTEKDAVKLCEFKKELALVPVFALCMDVQIHQQERWQQFLINAVS